MRFCARRRMERCRPGSKGGRTAYRLVSVPVGGWSGVDLSSAWASELEEFLCP